MSTQDFFVTGSVSACVHCLFVVSFVPDSPSLSLLLEDFPPGVEEKPLLFPSLIQADFSQRKSGGKRVQGSLFKTMKIFKVDQKVSSE